MKPIEVDISNRIMFSCGKSLHFCSHDLKLKKWVTKYVVLVVKEHLKVRRVLAQPKPHEDSFTALIAGMGKSANFSRRNSTPSAKSRRTSAPPARFQVESDCDRGDSPDNNSSKENGRFQIPRQYQRENSLFHY